MNTPVLNWPDAGAWEPQPSRHPPRNPPQPTSLSRLRSSAIWEISWGLGFTHLRKKLSSVPFTLVSMLVLRFLFRAWANTCSALHIWKREGHPHRSVTGPAASPAGWGHTRGWLRGSGRDGDRLCPRDCHPAVTVATPSVPALGCEGDGHVFPHPSRLRREQQAAPPAHLRLQRLLGTGAIGPHKVPTRGSGLPPAWQHVIPSGSPPPPDRSDAATAPDARRSPPFLPKSASQGRAAAT